MWRVRVCYRFCVALHFRVALLHACRIQEGIERRCGRLGCTS